MSCTNTHVASLGTASAPKRGDEHQKAKRGASGSKRIDALLHEWPSFEGPSSKRTRAGFGQGKGANVLEVGEAIVGVAKLLRDRPASGSAQFYWSAERWLHGDRGRVQRCCSTRQLQGQGEQAGPRVGPRTMLKLHASRWCSSTVFKTTSGRETPSLLIPRCSCPSPGRPLVPRRRRRRSSSSARSSRTPDRLQRSLRLTTPHTRCRRALRDHNRPDSHLNASRFPRPAPRADTKPGRRRRVWPLIDLVQESGSFQVVGHHHHSRAQPAASGHRIPRPKIRIPGAARRLSLP